VAVKDIEDHGGQLFGESGKLDVYLLRLSLSPTNEMDFLAKRRAFTRHFSTPARPRNNVEFPRVSSTKSAMLRRSAHRVPSSPESSAAQESAKSIAISLKNAAV